ncbi:ABC transporter permease [Clostridium sp.]|uniref:ABC transporter permease n=1 Tax=Clostridium sp. TaxID=1506 RepID=UPI002FC8F7A2
MKAVIKSVILKSIREPSYLLFSMFFPIFLIILLGSVLGNYFEQDGLKLEGKKIYYNESLDKKEFVGILDDEVKKVDSKFEFEKIEDNESAITKVKNDGSIFINFDKDRTNIYVAKGDEIYYSYLSSIIRGIDSTINGIGIVYSIDPNMAETIIKGDIISPEIELLSKEKAPSAFDYYAVVEITMMTLYIMIFPFDKIYDDRKRGIYKRMKLTGVTDGQYYIGTVIGYFVLSFAITLPGFLFSKFVLKTNWGENPLIIYGAIQVLSLASIMVGMCIAKYVKNKEKSMTAIQGVILPIMSFLGGSYMSLPDDVGGVFQIITNISPIRWINRGIFRAVYTGEYKLLGQATLINISIIIFASILIFLRYRKREDRI